MRSSWVAVALLSGGLSGCPDEDDCTGPEESVELAPAETDPNLATFEGTFTWLQTGDETTLRFSTSRAATLGTKRCGHTAMEVNQALETTDGLVAAEWRPTENNRRAKYYALTPAGRARLRRDTRDWEAQTAAIARILQARPEEL